MRVFKYREMNKEDITAIISRNKEMSGEINDRVKEIIEEVKAGGDKSLIALEMKFDACDLSGSSFYVTEKEIYESEELIDKRLKESIDISIDNIKNFHSVQLTQKIWLQTFNKGIIAGEMTNPIESVALYVPHGKGTFPSVAIMLGVPATLAGVKRIIVATPPDKNCKVDNNVLYVCKKLGITKIIKLGGAQAIAALTFGTESVEKVSKILGPGSPYINVAKQMLAGRVDIGLLAGPSESVIIADDEQNPINVSLDLMNEAEHGPDSTALLLTNSYELAKAVESEINKRIEKIEKNRREYIKRVLEVNGGAIVFDNLDEAIEFSNKFAPEHLVLNVSHPFDEMKKIENAGEVLIGPNTPISAGNYIAGPNAVLPTNGFAKSMSALSVRDFLKTTSILQFSLESLNFYKDHIKILATAEGFPAHAMSAYERVPIKNKEDEVEPGITVNYFAGSDIILTRKTRESIVTVSIFKGQRDPEGKRKIKTGLDFLNHMIETISWRSGFNISTNISLDGSYKLMHVVAEDIGITLGTAISKLIQRQFAEGIEGSGFSYGIIDEAESSVAISFEGRSLCKIDYKIPISFEFVEDMKSVDLENFLSGFVQGARCTIHASILSGTDPHHIWESLFRSFGESLRRCFDKNEFRKGTTPGVKGI